MVQLEAAVSVAVAVAAVAASWLLAEDKMYFLPASAVRTTVDGNNAHVIRKKGRGKDEISNTKTPLIEILEKVQICKTSEAPVPGSVIRND